MERVGPQNLLILKLIYRQSNYNQSNNSVFIAHEKLVLENTGEAKSETDMVILKM